MKYAIMLMCLLFFNVLHINSQTIVAKNSGVELSYSYRHIETVSLGLNGKFKYDEFEITFYILNNSGNDIFVNSASLDFGSYTDHNVNSVSTNVQHSFYGHIPSGSMEKCTKTLRLREGNKPNDPDYYWNWKFGKTAFDSNTNPVKNKSDNRTENKYPDNEGSNTVGNGDKKVVAKNSGVELSYSYKYIQTVSLGLNGMFKYDEYEITFYIENNSGNDIFVNSASLDFGSYIDHNGNSVSTNIHHSFSGHLPTSSFEKSYHTLRFREGNKPNDPGYNWNWKFGKTAFDSNANPVKNNSHNKTENEYPDDEGSNTVGSGNKLNIAKDSGIELSYSYKYIQTVSLGLNGMFKYDEYEITFYIENNSGNDVLVNSASLDFGSYIDHNGNSVSTNIHHSFSGHLPTSSFEKSYHTLRFREGNKPNDPGYNWNWKFENTDIVSNADPVITNSENDTENVVSEYNVTGTWNCENEILFIEKTHDGCKIRSSTTEWTYFKKIATNEYLFEIDSGIEEIGIFSVSASFTSDNSLDYFGLKCYRR